MLKQAGQLRYCGIACRTHEWVHIAVIRINLAFFDQFFVVIFVDKVAPFETFRCEHIEFDVINVAACTGFEMDDLWCVSICCAGDRAYEPCRRKF